MRGGACHTSARTIAAVGRPRMEAAIWLEGTFWRAREGLAGKRAKCAGQIVRPYR